MRLESPGGLDLGKLQVEWWWIADFLLLMRNMVSCCMTLFWGEAGYVCNSNGMAWLWLFCCCVQCSLISCHAHTNVVLIVLTYVLFYCHVILCFIVLYVCWLNKKIQWCIWFYPFTPPIISHACGMHLAKAVSAARRKRFPHCKPEDLQEPVRALTWFLGTCYFQSDVNSTKQATSNRMLSFFTIHSMTYPVNIFGFRPGLAGWATAGRLGWRLSTSPMPRVYMLNDFNAAEWEAERYPWYPTLSEVSYVLKMYFPSNESKLLLASTLIPMDFNIFQDGQLNHGQESPCPARMGASGGEVSLRIARVRTRMVFAKNEWAWAVLKKIQP